MNSVVVHLTKKSSNVKTGKIPVSTSTKEYCPTACKLKGNGCYASCGHFLSMHWNKVTRGERGTTWAEFCDTIKKLPKGQLWRHNQAGDLPGSNNVIDWGMVQELIGANEAAGAKGYTYTHYPATPDNRMIVAQANRHGFTVNWSADSLSEVDDLLQYGPVCVVVAEDYTGGFTPGGTRVVTCPAQTSDKVTCATCGLCARSNRKVVIGFQAHGTQKKKAAAIAAGG